MSLWQRLSLYPWRVEIFSLGFMALYFVLYKLGSAKNKSLADKFIESIVPTLKDNFYQVGVTNNKLFAQDDAQNYSLYASGRLRLEYFLAKVELQARQNLFFWLMEYLMAFFVESVPTPADTISIEIKYDEETSEKFDNFIWAIVTKDNMNSYRKDSYFLSLTKTSESDKLPVEFVFMNEAAEISDVLVTKKFSDLIAQNKDTLKYFAITDQGIDKPVKMAELKPNKKILMQFTPSTDATKVEAINNFVSYVVNDFADMIVQRGSFRPELTRKIKKTRENEYNKLKKLLDDFKREELAQVKAEEQKKKQQSLTPKEQQKLKQKQQDKKQRKMMNRQKVRG